MRTLAGLFLLVAALLFTIQPQALLAQNAGSGGGGLARGGEVVGKVQCSLPQKTGTDSGGTLASNGNGAGNDCVALGGHTTGNGLLTSRGDGVGNGLSAHDGHGAGNGLLAYDRHGTGNGLLAHSGNGAGNGLLAVG